MKKSSMLCAYCIILLNSQAVMAQNNRIPSECNNTDSKLIKQSKNDCITEVNPKSIILNRGGLSFEQAKEIAKEEVRHCIEGKMKYQFDTLSQACQQAMKVRRKR